MSIAKSTPCEKCSCEIRRFAFVFRHRCKSIRHTRATGSGFVAKLKRAHISATLCERSRGCAGPKKPSAPRRRCNSWMRMTSCRRLSMRAHRAMALMICRGSWTRHWMIPLPNHRPCPALPRRREIWFLPWAPGLSIHPLGPRASRFLPAFKRQSPWFPFRPRAVNCPTWARRILRPYRDSFRNRQRKHRYRRLGHPRHTADALRRHPHRRPHCRLTCALAVLCHLPHPARPPARRFAPLRRRPNPARAHRRG